MTRRRQLRRRLFWTGVLLGLLLLVLAATVAHATVAAPRSASRLVSRLAGRHYRHQGGTPMRRNRTIFGLALTIAVLVGSVSLASASPTAPAPSTMTLIAVDVPNSEIYIDGGAQGDGPGDLVIFTERLHRGSARGPTVGRTEISCLVLSRRGFHCDGTLLLPAGRIEAAGFISFEGPRTFRVAVLGGTQRYAGARGELVITSLGETRDRYVIRLVA